MRSWYVPVLVSIPFRPLLSIPGIGKFAIVQEFCIGKAVEKRDQIVLFRLRQCESADDERLVGIVMPRTRIRPGVDRPSACGIVVDHFTQSRNAAIVHVRSGHGDVPQCWGAELSNVFAPISELKQSCIWWWVRKLTSNVVQAGVLKYDFRRSAALIPNKAIKVPASVTTKATGSLA